ncbi:hypothetical protein EGR_06956 [Echinococcus granulosus]|uniref:Protein FMC1 homolog n=1 Tax=Echinococcus granulosus TaxID=6210 RepID=W6UJ94_ECHGR|nr:hypothetical protein EGR_06956 [Echinococcus granulosus]EUB58212.1 hypothetical protein EGR_06956 [Echinococcus granulosus]
MQHTVGSDPTGMVWSPFYKYILSQFRRFDTTTEQQCSPKHESMQVAETYLTLLKAVARHRQLVNTYKCREKTASEAAKLMDCIVKPLIWKVDLETGRCFTVGMNGVPRRYNG